MHHESVVERCDLVRREDGSVVSLTNLYERRCMRELTERHGSELRGGSFSSVRSSTSGRRWTLAASVSGKINASHLGYGYGHGYRSTVANLRLREKLWKIKNVVTIPAAVIRDIGRQIYFKIYLE